MAIATLDRCFNNPLVFSGVVKIRRGLAAKILLNSSTTEDVLGWFRHFTLSMKVKARRAKIQTSKLPATAGRTHAAVESLLKKLGDGPAVDGYIAPGFLLLFGSHLMRMPEWPDVTGLGLGLCAVMVAQMLVLVYHIVRTIQLHNDKADSNMWPTLARQITGHVSQPEGFALLGLYLCGTWLLRLMPDSYYSLEGAVQWLHVLAQLLIVDLLQYTMHRLEHVSANVWPALYQASHKLHHRFPTPNLTDAFHGSPVDTYLMILVPLFLTSIVSGFFNCNVWSYIWFGALYSSQLCLIHSNYDHPWGREFRKAGIATSADHHVHHKLYKYNYGHVFMYWDVIFGTYKQPDNIISFWSSKNKSEEAPLKETKVA